MIKDFTEDIFLEDCPECGGPSLLEEECGNGYSVSCLDCGCHTVVIDFKSPEERETAARKAADLWNRGKAISSARGE